MANSTLYVGGGRVRISNEFGVSADPGSKARPSQLAFDSAWDQGMTVHWQGIVSKNTNKVSFNRLSYIPFVYVATVNSKGNTFYSGRGHELDGFKVGNNYVNLPNRDNPALVIVFRAKAFESGKQTGYVGSLCPRILLGKGGKNVNNDYGLFISRKGYNVDTCLESDMIFSSSRRIAGIIYASTFNLQKSSWSGGAYSELRSSGMKWPGYQPLAMIECSEPGKNQIYYPNNKGLDNSDDIETTKVKVNVTITESSAFPGMLALNFDGDNIGGNPGNVYLRVTLFDIPIKG